MTGIELVVLLLLVVVALALLARHVATPLPVLLALAGMGLGAVWHLLPEIPALRLPPDLVLTLALPPLLTYAAFSVPLGAFRANLRPITLLAVGLVLATMAASAATMRLVHPAMPWGAAFVLGAIVAPPDAVAATSVGGRLGLQNRLVTILEGEGLVNDATAFVLYQIAVAAVVSGRFSWAHAALQLLLVAPLGVVVGLVVGSGAILVRRHLDDPMLETTISLVVPYMAYIGAERVGGSPILAVVALGFLLRRRAPDIGAPRTRLTQATVWRTLDFLITGLVFMLVGIALGEITTRADVGRALLGPAAAVSATVVLVRLAWMYVVPLLASHVAARGAPHVSSWRERTALGWAGPRGVVSLALALAIPFTTADGRPFPGRETVILVSTAVIAATLVVQGLTLAPLIRRLGVGDASAQRRQEARARAAASHAGRERLAELVAQGQLTTNVRTVADRWLSEGLGVGGGTGYDEVRRAVLAAIDAERATVARLRNDGQLDAETAQRLETALDQEDVRQSARNERAPFERG